MSQQYQVTATFKGYRAAIVFVDADSASEAIESAKMGIVSRFDKIRANVVVADADQLNDFNYTGSVHHY